MASIFEQTIVPKINFSNFDLSRKNILTGNFGQLIPCFVQEVLPNDVFTLGGTAAVNFAPMVAPMYHDVNISLHFFYTPNRIVFDDFEQFITGAVEGYALPEDKIPTQPGLTIEELTDLAKEYNITSWQGTLLDYIGLPNDLFGLSQASGAQAWYASTIISDLVLRDYFKIWFDYYRDENLQATFKDTDDNDALYFDYWRKWRAASDPYFPAGDWINWFNMMNEFKPFYRAFKKDYFTACQPSPQKGEPVTLSLGGTAPVTWSNDLFFGPTDQVTPIRDGINAYFAGTPEAMEPLTIGDPMLPSLADRYLKDENSGVNLKGFVGQLWKDITMTEKADLKADLSKATALTVEQLREAFAVQEILESLSMRGSRYCEFLKGNFGVAPDDYKLQRPQFLGGLVTPVQVQTVLQQSGYSGEDSRDMTAYAAGRAFAGVGGRVFKQRFKEHGYILGILSVMPKAYYYQGIPRHFLRRDRFDYYLPQTAHLGEQGVQNLELFYNSLQSTMNDEVFGYIPRWAEYKTAVNEIHGDFRGNLDYYHMARTFEVNNQPTLSKEFILTTPDSITPRPFAVWMDENPDINHLCWIECYFKVTASRPMPYHSIPKVL